MDRESIPAFTPPPRNIKQVYQLLNSDILLIVAEKWVDDKIIPFFVTFNVSFRSTLLYTSQRCFFVTSSNFYSVDLNTR